MEAVAATLGVLLLLAGVMVWRVASGPVDVGFAKKYIEEALHDESTDTSITLGGVFLHWPKFSGPLELKLQDIHIQRKSRTLVSMDTAALGISTRHMLIGRLEPVSIILKHPVLGVIRTADNQFRLSPRAPGEVEPPADLTETDANTNILADIIASLSRPKGQPVKERSPLSALKIVRIEDATLALEDHYAGLTWYLQHANLEFGRDRKGLALSVALKLPSERQTPSMLQLDAVYGRDNGDLLFNLHLSDVDLGMGAGKLKQLDFLTGQKLVVTGNLSGRLNKAMELQTLALDLASAAGIVAVPGIYNEPLPYKSFILKAAYDGVNKKAKLSQAQIIVRDVAIGAAADVAFDEKAISADVKINLPKIAQEQIGPLWPDSLRGDGAEIWLVKKLSGGVASNLKVEFGIVAQRPMPASGDEPATGWITDVKNIIGGFDIAGTDIDYRAPLTPVKNASGRGVFKNGNLDLKINSGTIGDMKVIGSHVVLENIVHAKRGVANIEVKLAGPLKTVFKYIEDEPINMTREALGFDASGVKGVADMTVNVSFPTIKNLLAEQVKVKVNGTMQNVLLPGVVEGLSLAGGPFRLDVADAAATLSGKGTLENRPIDFKWQKYLHPEGKPFATQITAKLNGDEDLRKKFGVDLPDWVTGTLPVDVLYTAQANKNATVDVKADLTPGTVMVGPFDYIKNPGEQGNMTCTVVLQSGAVQGVTNLNVKTPDLDLKNGRLSFTQVNGKNKLSGGSLPATKLKDTNMAMDFTIDASGKIGITGKGAFLDATPFLMEKKDQERPKPPAPALSAAITVATMRTRPEREVKNVRLNIERLADGTLGRLEMDAVAGQGPMSFRLRPDLQGRMTLKGAADDAGAVLKAFDIYKNAVGGKLVIEGQSPDPNNKRLIVGKARLSDFKVANAPVLARLVNAISLTGIPELILGGGGLSFSRLEGDFEWNLRSFGDLYVIRNGRTAGASIGLTFEGTVDKQKKYTDIEGTIVPVSGINGLVGNIPVLGTILTGGGALFAFTYTVQGPSDSPGVSVNPISGLAPGILRKIFFEGD